MFKRVEKRRKKREEEEELGLDEDMKDVLGIQDTDSDESDSESDPNEAGGDSEREAAAENQRQDTGDEDEEGTSEGDGDPKRPTRTVKEALEEPLYIISLQPDVKGCIICPGKLLKNDQIANVHKLSNACPALFPIFISPHRVPRET
jgi:hypothetical protein